MWVSLIFINMLSRGYIAIDGIFTAMLHIKMASIVERYKEKQILDRGSWLRGRGFRYLECSPILDMRIHLRNDVEVDGKDDIDDDDNDDRWWTMVSATCSYRAWEHLWSSRYASSS